MSNFVIVVHFPSLRVPNVYQRAFEIEAAFPAYESLLDLAVFASLPHWAAPTRELLSKPKHR
jgi:hypothetical protein